MKTMLLRASLATGGMMAVGAGALTAHEGHGWLTGAAQPLLGLDHFLAAVFLVATVTLGLVPLARRARERSGPPE